MPNKPTGLLHYLQYYGIGTLLLLLAGWQMYESGWRSLTRWKGGGFGMYAEVHYGARYLWAKCGAGTQPVRLDTLSTQASSYHRALLNAQRQPHIQHLAELGLQAGAVLGMAIDTLEVWAPNVATISNGYTMRPMVTYIPATNQRIQHVE